MTPSLNWLPSLVLTLYSFTYLHYPYLFFWTIYLGRVLQLIVKSLLLTQNVHLLFMVQRTLHSKMLLFASFHSFHVFNHIKPIKISHLVAIPLHALVMIIVVITISPISNTLLLLHWLLFNLLPMLINNSSTQILGRIWVLLLI